MVDDIGTALTGVVAIGVILMGARAFWAPAGAAGFGIPDTRTDDPSFQAWLTVKAVRDIGCGALLLVVLVGGTTHLLGWAMVAAAGIPVGDALIVARSGGPKSAVYGIHVATALAMGAIGVLLLAA